MSIAITLENFSMKQSDDLLDQIGRRAAGEQDERRCIATPELDPGRLLAFRNGRLAEADAEKLRGHLIECTHCRRYVGDLRPATREELRKWQGKSAGQPILWAVTAMMLVAGLSAAVLMNRVEAPPGYAAERIEGGVKLNKSSAPQADTYFLPESRLSWLLRPAERLEKIPSARAFAVANGALTPLPADGLQRVDGGGWLLEIEAKAALGETFGERELVIAVSFSDKALRSLDGKKWESARDNGDVQYYSRTIRYRAELEGSR